MFGEAACESRTGERGKYSRDGDYSLKRRGCEALAAAAAGFLRATPTTPRTVTSESPPLLRPRSEEHTSELQSHHDLVCRLLLEKKKKTKRTKHKRRKTKDYH